MVFWIEKQNELVGLGKTEWLPVLSSVIVELKSYHRIKTYSTISFLFICNKIIIWICDSGGEAFRYLKNYK